MVLFLRHHVVMCQNVKPTAKASGTCFSTEFSDITEGWKVVNDELQQLYCTSVALSNNVDKTSTKFLPLQNTTYRRY